MDAIPGTSVSLRGHREESSEIEFLGRVWMVGRRAGMQFGRGHRRAEYFAGARRGSAAAIARAGDGGLQSRQWRAHREDGAASV